MSDIATKLTTIAENQQKVYDAGHEKGVTDGKQAEYDIMWDQLQAKGAAMNYFWMFAYGRFSNATYNPKYDIRCSEATVAGQNVFYSSDITDTKVAIYANKINITGMFYWWRDGVTIRKLVVHESTTYNSAFTDCISLVNLTMEGTIGQSGFDVRSSTKLSKASIESVISVLSATTSGLYITFSKVAVDKAFETSEGAADGSTSDEWTALIATKPNWTINLA